MMEDEEHKTCPNCKRDIPVVNFTIHNVHCARNIKVCPVCKEPVPQAQLEEHYEALHKPVPCKQCGESVCGTDLEDHIRDSCGHTIKSCRYCELELPRRDLPSHEGYCGVRTEQCPECREYVMIKYKQLHLDSNHGFLRLDDDPPPIKKEPTKPVIPPLNFIMPARPINNINLDPAWQRTTIRYFGTNEGASGSGIANSNPANNKRIAVEVTINPPSTSRYVQNAILEAAAIRASRGAVKKRTAPKPPREPREPPVADPRRENAFRSAAQRRDQEERLRDEQSRQNIAQGLPPVLSPAAKLEKLRKMDALQNPNNINEDYKNRLQGKVWMPKNEVASGSVLGGRPDLRNLKPMSPEEFMDRFNGLQVREPQDRDGRSDRFSEIKSSLRELRRGLNEVTAPYNSNANVNNGDRHERARRSPAEDSAVDNRLPCEFCGAPMPPDLLVQHQNTCRPDVAQVRNCNQELDLDLESDPESPSATVIPCEFCGLPVPAQDLVQHQTGCRPDLAQLMCGNERPRRVRPPAPPLPQDPYEEPVIPCEFCTESLPVCFINEHQERCRRDNNRLFPD